jgi:uncharacterized membrane protein
MGTSFEYGKTLAGEGAILLILGVVPYVGWVLGIIGVILLLRGVKELANYYQDNEIYQNSLTGVKYYIVALIAAAVAVAAIVIGVGTATGFKFTSFTLTAGFGIGLIAFIGGLIIAFIFNVLAALHLRKAFDTLAQKSGDHTFATASTLLWVGAILTIIVVGFLIIFIAWIFAVIGFFSMRPPQQQQNTSQPHNFTPPPAQLPTQSQQTPRYCSNCGTPVTPDATYCPNCGKQLKT